jgi:hypothetical protein
VLNGWHDRFRTMRYRNGLLRPPQNSGVRLGCPRLLELPNSAHQNDVQINCIHSGAVCDAVGETLSVTLGPQSNELPLRLAGLMKQLAMDETDGIEHMKDFSNALFPPDIIKSYEAGSERRIGSTTSHSAMVPSRDAR